MEGRMEACESKGKPLVGKLLFSVWKVSGWCCWAWPGSKVARGVYCRVGSMVMAEGRTGTPVKDVVSRGWGKEGLEQTVA